MIRSYSIRSYTATSIIEARGSSLEAREERAGKLLLAHHLETPTRLPPLFGYLSLSLPHHVHL
jgi:hypothetical protein